MDHAEIFRIKNQFLSGHWPRFLNSLEIAGLRGWNGQVVSFNFPVTALVGENGTGKSTVLRAAACAYENEDASKTYYPSAFFANTFWDRIEGVTLNYRTTQGPDSIPFRISKPSVRWSFPEKRLRRPVFFYDISRTLPLDASVGYAKIARLAAAEISTTDIAPDFRERLSFVLGRQYRNARFAFSDADKNRAVGLLEREFGEISQFHQGAGEDATLDLFRALQEIPEYSLLIIDEVEASLHPKAQRRLIRFLLWLARQRRIQVILSTHSPYVLEELPQEARILLIPSPASSGAGTSIVYGATPEFALSRIDEEVHPDLLLFVEDREAAIFLREVLASDPSNSDILTRVSLIPVGPANVVKLLGTLGVDGRLPFASLAFLDGDVAPSEGCVLLPGPDAPERVVFEGLKTVNWTGLPDRFGIGAGTLIGILDDVILTPDHHKWAALVGDRVLKSAQSVWEILCGEWSRSCLEPGDRMRIHASIADALSSLT